MGETSPLATVAKALSGVSDERHRSMRATQGRPMCGVEVRIVDDEGNHLPADDTAVGELEVRGPPITGSYVLDRDADRFQSGWLRTGYVALTDRAKDVIKSGGEWISSVELENHLIAHPAVLEAAVVGVPDDRWQERPLAVTVLHDGSGATPEELHGFLADKVVRWWPSDGRTFVEQVPRTSVGKYDKKTIRARQADGDYEVNTI